MRRTAVLHHALTPLFCRKPHLVIFGACVGAILLSATAHADCLPAPSQDQAEPLSNNSPTDDDSEIQVDADSLETTHEGTSTLRGNVEIRQGQRTLHTREATFDAATQTFQVDSEVDYSDPNLQV